ncbi:MerR family transcriptional regulator [Rickettsiales bacterium]|nr:MerR family transcriptional regulator [Rickettsiales bacterium]
MSSEKSPTALRTIGEVAEELGVATHVLRFWENKFNQINPQKRRGRRYYRPEDIKTISQIKSLLYNQGYTIKGVKNFLSKRNSSEQILLGSVDNIADSDLLEDNDNLINIDNQKDLFGESVGSSSFDSISSIEFNSEEISQIEKMRDQLVSIRDSLREDS